MTWFTDLGTPYHQQDTDYYCGAAVAQMILDSIGSGLIDQDTLYASNHSHSTGGWYTSPDGLNFTLNAFMPPPPKFNSFFIVEIGNTEPQGSENIIRTLRYFSVATGSLVYGCGHWVAVRGAKTDVDPAGEDGSYTIEGFYINNPWPPTPSFYNPSLGAPPPHADPDACGTGGERGNANEYVTYADWQANYHTGCDVYGVGHLQFVSVCDPRRPPLKTLKLQGQTRLRDGSKLITSKEAMELATHGLQAHLRRGEKCTLTPALEGARAASADLVQRLDRPDEFYYLVTLHRARKPTAVLRGDGLYGTFQGALSLSGEKHSPIISRDAALEALRKGPLDLGDGIGRVHIRDGAYCFYPHLVWRPCRESRSPYYPFHQIAIGGVTIYVGYDGQIYTALHDLGMG
ncbi:MAG TPA: hypothetical protein VKG91_10265 [Roseiarcus sp.]|nr:hypothetical protein [Roseiarcus sp.]